MPLYDYLCPNCNTTIEIYKTFDRVVYCNVCGSHMQQLVCKSNFVLKGGGWANDGYSIERGQVRDSASSGE